MRIVGSILVALAIAACAPAPRYAGLGERFSGKAVANPDLRRLILVRTEAYWATVAAGNWDDAYEYFTGDYQEKNPFPTWRQLPHAAWSMPPRPTSIHWTQDAQRTHGPELYAIVEWTASEGAAGSEGALIWRQEPDGSFLLENTIIREASQSGN